jgi:hypothetical protein
MEVSMDPRRIDLHERLNYPTYVALVGLVMLLIAVYGLVDRIDRNADKADNSAERGSVATIVAAQRIIAARELARGFEKCPPQDPGMTTIVTLIVRTRPDNMPEVVTCIRYAERPLAPRTRRQAFETVIAGRADR